MDRPEILEKVLEQIAIARSTGILDCTNFGIKKWDSEVLGDLPFVTQLRLSRNEIGDSGVEALSSTMFGRPFGFFGLLPRLTHLDLEWNGIEDSGAAALSKAPHLASLTVLNLGWNSIGASGAEALSKATHLASLTHLNLESNEIGASGAEALSKATHLASLTHLNLGSNEIGTSGAEALSKATHLASLTHLDLRSNQIGASGAAALSKATHLASLTHLNLETNEIGGSGAKALSAEALSKATHLASLTHLNLESNEIGDSGAKALSKATHLASLTYLHLGSNEIGASGAKALSKAAHLASLTDLHLGLNHIGDSGAEALSKATHLASLTDLHLGLNQIGDSGVEALSKATHLASLTHLNLGTNEIGASGVEALLKATHLASLTDLHLGSNHIGDPGAAALSKATHLASLTDLDLRDNHIGGSGAEALSKATHLASLTDLHLRSNKIGDSGAEALALSNVFVKLKWLYLKNNKVNSYDVKKDNSYDRLRRHFQRIHFEKTLIANEVRLFLIGHPKAGKSTLFDKVFDPASPVPNPDKRRTIGVDISRPWKIEVIPAKEKLPNIQAYLWDFGGDEIQYMCHQYFLSKEVLYALLLRSDTTEKQIHYWLQTLSNLAPKARVLPVKNVFEPSQRLFSWQDGTFGQTYKGKLTFLDPITVDFKSDHSSKKLNTRLQQELNDSEFMSINTGFKNGRDQLLEWAKTNSKDYVTIEQFEDWCGDYLNAPKEDDHYVEDFLHYLYWVGAVIYFENLKLIVLHFEWITKGLYTVLPPTDETREISGNQLNEFYEAVLRSKGYFSRQALLNAWQTIIPKAPSRERLFEILEENALDVIYPIEDKKEHYFVPAYLDQDIDPVDWMKPLKSKSPLVIGYEFDFIPHGLMSRLIVRFNREIKRINNKPEHWKNGFILVFGDSQIEGYIFKLEKVLWLVLYAVENTPIVNAFSDTIRRVEALLTSGYHEIKPLKKVPCPNCFDTNQFDNVPLLPYEDLEDQYEYRRGKVMQYCSGCHEEVDLTFIFDQHAKTRSDNSEKENSMTTYNIHGPVHGAVGDHARVKIDTQNIQNNMQTLAENGNDKLAEAITKLINEVGASDELDEENKQEAIKSLELLSNQAILAPEKRQSNLKTTAKGIGSILGAGGSLATLWTALSPVIIGFFS